MLDALADVTLRELAWKQLPHIVDHCQPLGRLSESLALEAGLKMEKRPYIFPTSDDQQAGLVGGGAVDAGQMAIILGNSAVVNSSSDRLPQSDRLDVMRLNWGPYLWMRCYTNGAQFIDHVVGRNPNWQQLEQQARAVEAGCGGVTVLPFIHAEPSIGVTKKRFEWIEREPGEAGVKYRAALEGLGYLIALGVQQHEESGQKIERITVSGGIARSNLMCEILASVLGRRLERLQSDEGPALGAAVTALAALESHERKQHNESRPYHVLDAVTQMVKFRAAVEPNGAWVSVYRSGLQRFERLLAT
jgi:sugar (pentulose or hexulose) kinase